MKNISKKKIIGISIILVIVAAIAFLVYFFFSPKSYTYYINEGIGKLQAVEIGLKEEDTVDIWLYDEEIASELFDAMESIEAWPFCSSGETNPLREFSIEFMDENGRRLYYWAEDCDYYYVVNLGIENNGIWEENTIWNLMENVCISKEDGDRLYELISGKYEENICDISVDYIEELSNDKITDWKRFQRFMYTEEEGSRIEKGDLYSETPVRFQIEGKKGYMLVWYCDSTIVDEKGTNRYLEVLQATVYSEKGESMDLYDDGIGEFLEVME